MTNEHLPRRIKRLGLFLLCVSPVAFLATTLFVAPFPLIAPLNTLLWFVLTLLGAFLFLQGQTIGRLSIGKTVAPYVLAVPAFAALLFGAYSYMSSVPVVFRSTFGFPAPDDVTEVQMKYSYFGDFGCTYLRLRSSKPLFDRMATARGLKNSPAQSNGALGVTTWECPSSNAQPPWWPTTPPVGIVELAADYENRDFSRETEYLAFDAKSGEIFYVFIGVD